MCKKDPKDCKAEVKCLACIKRQEMSHLHLHEAYVKAKENDDVKSYKITVDRSQKDSKLSLNEVDNLNEQEEFIINVKGDIK